MAQSITWLGNTYNNVGFVDLPKTGSGTARFDDCSVVTAVASDVTSGKIFVASDGTPTTGTASGGGGASNIVTGTFKGTTTGAAMDVTLNYTGSGYPIIVVVFPTGGIVGNTTFNNLVQRYALAEYFIIKRDTTKAPRYTMHNTYDAASIGFGYKSNATYSSYYSTSFTMNSFNGYYDGAATDSSQTHLRIRSATKMSVYIASSSYGFAANIEYTYQITYSS